MTDPNITRDEAGARAALLDVTSYAVELDLTTSETTFRTVSTVTFTCREPGADTFIDFIGESVEAITLNDRSIDPAEAFTGTRIRLADLGPENTLRVEATGTYMNTGEGLHRFVDPADGEVYLYTQFEVADCRRMFAVFEQPDLKATFAFTVTAPAHWQVLSNTATPEPQRIDDSRATWAFEPTERISCYITALVAGPYDVVRDELVSGGRTIPLGVFCRRSLTRYLDADEIIDITKRGFAFFEREFDHPYPFSKYDQVFTPEYNAGAMENAGCVTYNEVYVFRSRVPEAIVERRALTILHELAHMWFGNLVTMRWWNDLWLNESFAEWASTTAQAEATRWSDAWTTFATSEKAWAYRQDQLSSTHPVVAPIRDLQDVLVNFDGITYAKGASALKQLVAWVGREAFVEGLRSYFRAHAWRNTTLDDLLDEIEKFSDRDLRAWSAAWLETAGVNTLRPVVEVDEQGRYSSVVVEQTHAPDLPTLRPHRIAVGAYRLRDGRLERTERVEIDVVGERTEVPGLVGVEQPDLLLVNDDDLSYAKVRLDARSLSTATEHVAAFTESLPASLVLASAWDMTRDAELPGRQFVDLVLGALPTVTDSTLLRTLLQQLSTTVLTYSDPASRDDLRARVRDALEALARTAEPGNDAQLQLVGAWAGLLEPGDETALAAGLLDGSAQLPGLVVDTDMRWRLLAALAAAGAADEDRIAQEADGDRTATGQEWAALCRAARPTAEAKTTAWESVAAAGASVSNSVVMQTGLGLTRTRDEALLRPFAERYLAEISGVWGSRTHAIAEAVVEYFYPMALADARLLDDTQSWLDTHPDAPAGLRRLVAEKRDAVTRALRAQERDATT